jgi:NAD(P)-dependent dehydrogenase (short-subunit alcohol dehydrogenase family)
MTKQPNSPGTALVTGGARRIGRAISLMLAARGYNIALHYNHSKDEAQALAKEIAGLGVKCQLFECDLFQEKDVLLLLEKVHAQFSDLNLLINNASIFPPSKFDQKDYKLIDDNYAIHVRAPFILSAEFARLCKEGQIINMLDTKIAQHKTSHIAYIISKKALQALTELSAIEFAPRIRVNGVAPGPILAPPGKNGDYIKQRGQEIPLKMPGDVRYITQTIEFLLDNEFVTGQVIFADGGEHLI